MKGPTAVLNNSKKIKGMPTRGKTHSNRLRRVDRFLIRYDPQLIKREDGLFGGSILVDLGFGEYPHTTLESMRVLRKLNPGLGVIGVEIDAERVARAQVYCDEITRFRRGGFNLPIRTGHDGTEERVRAIRAFNVLRQYDEASVGSAYYEMGKSVVPGGLLVEGTSDPLGRIWVANIMRRCDESRGHRLWHLEAIVFSISFKCRFNPVAFQTVLPKSWIHQMGKKNEIQRLFEHWNDAVRKAEGYRHFGQRALFKESAQLLAQNGHTVVLRKRWLNEGVLIWKHPPLDSL